MDFLRKILWVAIFVVSTLCFVVLFEHGPNQFIPNLQKQFGEVAKFVTDQVNPPKTDKAL